MTCMKLTLWPDGDIVLLLEGECVKCSEGVTEQIGGVHLFLYLR